jgi:type VI protein secretion system component VasA
MERLASGIVKFESKPASFRFIAADTVFYERGWRLDITLDEEAYAGVGCFVFALVLKEALFSLTPLGTCLEITLYTVQSGYITTWKATEN